MSSPLFSESTFENLRAENLTGETMTLKGAVNKSLLLFITMLVPAAWIWWEIQSQDPWIVSNLKTFLIGSLIIGFVLALVISFKKTWAPALAPAYAAVEGVFLGIISVFFEAKFPGIILQASTITMLIFGAMLVAYRTGLLRATPKFTKIIVFATLGIALFYLVTMIMGAFGINSFYNGNGILSIVVSVVISGIAAFNLILDFNLIDDQAKAGAPKYMEWYCAFGLLVTVVWLYIEILRLLSKISSRD
jgi:uncharacterized YccA/Bax inhibitor family protein